MTTTIGAVIYGIPFDIANKALQVGIIFYEHMDISIEECVYTIKTDPDKDGETLHLVNATVEDLQEKTKSGEAKSFALYNHELNTGSWSSAFSYSIREHGSFQHIDIQTIKRDDATLSKLKDFMKDLSQKINFEYVIFFEGKGAAKTWQYGDAGTIGIFKNESTFMFERMSYSEEFNSPEYFRDKLRMVYPINIINKTHLSMDVGGESLEEWIKKDPENGVLSEFSDYHFLWEVEEFELERVNDELGRAGVLLSWKELPTKPKRKLP